MQIVIDIPDEMYRRIALAPTCARGLDAYRDRDSFVKAIQNGTPLDKIRAEIMSKDGLEEALEIIDKYKAESEVNNG